MEPMWNAAKETNIFPWKICINFLLRFSVGQFLKFFQSLSIFCSMTGSQHIIHKGHLFSFYLIKLNSFLFISAAAQFIIKFWTSAHGPKDNQSNSRLINIGFSTWNSFMKIIEVVHYYTQKFDAYLPAKNILFSWLHFSEVPY